jgi:hypothetical protein
VELRVETPGGDVVRGRTVIPGARSIDVRTRGDDGPSLTLDHATDSVWIDADPIAGRALTFELTRDPSRSPYGAPDEYFYTLTTDTMSMVLAGDLRSFEDSDEGEAVFMPGRYLTLTVGVTDTNYYDFVRSYSNPLTGRGFINHLEGGVGVFGSVCTSERTVRVIDPQEDEREGLYRIRGTIEDVPVDVTLDVYLEPYRRRGEFSAFLDGTWVDGPLSTSVDGQYEYATAYASSGPGTFEVTLATVSDGRPVWYVIAAANARATQPFDAWVTAVVEIERYYYMNYELGPIAVERVAPAPSAGGP